LPPFGVVRPGGPLPGAVQPRAVVAVAPVAAVAAVIAVVATAEPVESDGWYDDAVTESHTEPVARAMTEPEPDAFDAAVRDLPLYVPDNVDRWTPRVNTAIPAEAIRAEPEPVVQETAAAEQWAAFVAATPAVEETPTREWRSPSLTPTRVATPVLPAEAVEAVAQEAYQELHQGAQREPHRMTPMRVTPMRATPVMGVRTPIRPQSPVEGSAVIGMVPSAGNRAVAAALEAVAAQVRRGELVVDASVPEGTHSLAAALAAALGALLGVTH
jgi:hypothetical protein